MAEPVRILGINGAGGVAPSVSRLLRTNTPGVGRPAWDMVVLQDGEPLLDAELNLYQQVLGEHFDLFIGQLALAGWTATGTVSYSPAQNALFLGESWACAKGRFLHVANPDLPGSVGGESLPASGTVVSLTLPPPSSSRVDLVWLEFWYHEVAAAGTITPNDSDPTRTSVYKEGGVANLTLTNDLMDPALGLETSRRVQLRWRWRETLNVDFTAHPLILGDPQVVAQGGAAAQSSLPFTQISNPNGGTNLWRAGAGSTGDAATLNTVDGYSYAILGFRLDRTSLTTTVTDIRPPTRFFIPNRSIHTLQLALGTDPMTAGVEGTLGTNGSNIKPGTVSGTDIGPNTINDSNLNGGTITRRVIANATLTAAQMDPSAWPGVVYAQNQVATAEDAPNGSVVRLNVSGGALVFAKPVFDNDTGVVGVVENYPADRIPYGGSGYVRVGGYAANVTVNPDTVPVIPASLVTKAGSFFARTTAAAGSPVGAFGTVFTSLGSGQYSCWLHGPLYQSSEIDRSLIRPHTLTDGEVAFANQDPYDNAHGDSTVPSLRRLDSSGTNPGAACGASDARLTNARVPTGAAGGHLTGSFPNPNIANHIVTPLQLQDNCVTDAAEGTKLYYTMATNGYTTTDNTVQAVTWATAGFVSPPNLISTYSVLGFSEPWLVGAPTNFVIRRTGLYEIEVEVWWQAVNQAWYSSVELYRPSDGYLVAVDAGGRPSSSAVGGVPNGGIYGSAYTMQGLAYKGPLVANDVFQVRLFSKTPSGAGVIVDRVRIALTRVGNFA